VLPQPNNHERQNIMTDEPRPLYRLLERARRPLLRLFGIDTAGTSLTADRIAEAQEEGWTPEDSARWYGEKYDLNYLDDWKT
jgi:hypothetical protein